MKKLYLSATAILVLHGLFILTGIIVSWDNIDSISLLKGPGFRALLITLLVYGLLAKTSWGWWGSVLYSAFMSVIGIGLIGLIFIAKDQNDNILTYEFYTLLTTTVLLGLSAFFLIYPVLKTSAKKS